MPAPTQRQILEGRRGLIPPVPVHAAQPAPAPATAEQVAQLIALVAENNRLVARIADAVAPVADGPTPDLAARLTAQHFGGR